MYILNHSYIFFFIKIRFFIKKLINIITNNINIKNKINFNF